MVWNLTSGRSHHCLAPPAASTCLRCAVQHMTMFGSDRSDFLFSSCGWDFLHLIRQNHGQELTKEDFNENTVQYMWGRGLGLCPGTRGLQASCPCGGGGQQSRAKGYIKCPGGWGRCPRLKLQQSAESCPHTRVFFVVSQQVALSRHWDLCGAPLPGRLSPEREAAGVIARYRCCVSS